MRLDKNLNLVLKLSDDKGEFIVHCIPLPATIFSANYKLFRLAFEEMTDGSIKSAVTLATLIFKDVAERVNKAQVADDIIATLKGAITIIRGKSALFDQSDLDEDIKEEVLNRLLFFIVWEFFVLPTEKKDFTEASAMALDITKTTSSVSDMLSSITTQSNTLMKESETTENTKVKASSPI